MAIRGRRPDKTQRQAALSGLILDNCMRRFHATLVAVLLALIARLPSAARAFRQEQDASAVAASPWSGGYFPNHTVIDQNGKSYRFWDDVDEGRTVVVNFMFTGARSCVL